MQRFLMIIALFLTASCASVFSGPRETIAVNSTPSGADALLDCKGVRVASGVTPARLVIRRTAGDCRLQVKKEGFREQQVLLEQGLNHRFWVNFSGIGLIPIGLFVNASRGSTEKTVGAAMVVAGVSPWIIDLATGAYGEHSPEEINVVLHPVEQESH